MHDHAGKLFQPTAAMRHAAASAGVVMLLIGPAIQPCDGAERAKKAQLAARSLAAPDKTFVPQPEPLRLPNSQLEPVDWSALDGWAADDHAAAFATFVTSRP